MRESIENLKCSTSLINRFVYLIIKTFGCVMDSHRREAIRRWFYRVTKLRPSFCCRVKEWGLIREPRFPRVIVSLTSYPKRISTVHRTIETLLTQTFKPDMVILWLGEDRFPNKEKDLPAALLRFRDFGLTIGWTKDIRSYTKLVPALKEFPEDVVVTGDDDMFYQSDWLEKLYRSYQADPVAVHCHYVKEVKIVNGVIRPYREWTHGKKLGAKEFRFLLMGVGGVLYPPHVLHSDVFLEERFKSLSPLNDDLWFWAMAVMNGTGIKLIEGGKGHPEGDCTASTENSLMNTNCGLEQRNDPQLAAIIESYPQLKKRLLK